RTATRDVSRERPVEVDLESSSARLEQWLASEQTSPSDKAIRNEQLLRMAESLAELPPDQRPALEMHHMGGLPVAEVARQMGRDEGAVGALMVRGLRKLRELMDE